MEIAAAIIFRQDAVPFAFNSLGARFIRSAEWSLLQPEVEHRLGSRSPIPSVFSIRRGGECAPWVVWMTPLYEFESGRNGVALCFVFDPDSQTAVSRALLQNVFRLTPAEVRLAEQLLQGRRPSEAAEALGVTIHTVRTYLKRLYHKVGARTQATLVRRLIQVASVPVLMAA